MIQRKEIRNKCKKVKIVLTDVDGVLNDGGRYYSEKGEVLRKFHVRDGMGINLLLRNDIKTIIVTKENSKIVKYWAKAMNVSRVYSGVKTKVLGGGLSLLNQFLLSLNAISTSSPCI